jgi:hypothetical protein
MDDAAALVAAALPFLLMGAVGALLWGPLRRLRERDKTSPPTPRALAIRMAPFAGALVAGAAWGIVSQHPEFVVYAAVGLPCFLVAIVQYSRNYHRD